MNHKDMMAEFEQVFGNHQESVERSRFMLATSVRNGGMMGIVNALFSDVVRVIRVHEAEYHNHEEAAVLTSAPVEPVLTSAENLSAVEEVLKAAFYEGYGFGKVHGFSYGRVAATDSGDAGMSDPAGVQRETAWQESEIRKTMVAGDDNESE